MYYEKLFFRVHYNFTFLGKQNFEQEENLIKRIERIGQYRDKISLFNLEIKDLESLKKIW